MVTDNVGGQEQLPGCSAGITQGCRQPLYQNLTQVLCAIGTLSKHSLLTKGRIAELVRASGLAYTRAVQHGTNLSIYGEEAAWMLSRAHGGKNGLWQVPAQLECALQQLSSKRIQHSLTIGTFSGWTDIFMTAILRRFAPSPSEYTHLTVDVISATVQSCVQRTLRNLNVTRLVLGDPPLVNRPEDAQLLPGRRFMRCTNRTSMRAGCSMRDLVAHDGILWDGVTGRELLRLRHVYDLCFIDGDHSYQAVKSDFEGLRGVCRTFLFHDIINAPRVGNLSTTLFWLETAAGKWQQPGSYEYSTVECTQQPAGSDGQLMGLGIVDVSTWRPSSFQG